MERREALRRLVVGGLGAATLPLWADRLGARASAEARHVHAALQVASSDTWTPAVFSTRQNETVIVISELIIPQTDTAGAKAAQVNTFIDTLLAGAPAAEREPFLQGLAWIDERSRQLFGTQFVEAGPARQTELLTRMSAGEVAEEDRPGGDFFRAIKALTITGYYTSEIGMREELEDDGRLFFLEFEGCTHPEHQG